MTARRSPAGYGCLGTLMSGTSPSEELRSLDRPRRAAQHPLDHTWAHGVPLAERGNGRQRIARLPLPDSDTLTQVALDALARPLRSPCHIFMIATVIRQLLCLSSELLESPESTSVRSGC